MRVLFESEFLRPMPKHRYFLEASNSNMYNHKERHFWPRKEQVQCLEKGTSLALLQENKKPCLLGSEGVERKGVGDKVEK